MHMHSPLFVLLACMCMYVLKQKSCACSFRPQPCGVIIFDEYLSLGVDPWGAHVIPRALTRLILVERRTGAYGSVGTATPGYKVWSLRCGRFGRHFQSAEFLAPEHGGILQSVSPSDRFVHSMFECFRHVPCTRYVPVTKLSSTTCSISRVVIGLSGAILIHSWWNKSLRCNCI